MSKNGSGPLKKLPVTSATYYRDMDSIGRWLLDIFLTWRQTFLSHSWPGLGWFKIIIQRRLGGTYRQLSWTLPAGSVNFIDHFT